MGKTPGASDQRTLVLRDKALQIRGTWFSPSRFTRAAVAQGSGEKSRRGERKISSGLTGEGKIFL